MPRGEDPWDPCAPVPSCARTDGQTDRQTPWGSPGALSGPGAAAGGSQRQLSLASGVQMSPGLGMWDTGGTGGELVETGGPFKAAAATALPCSLAQTFQTFQLENLAALCPDCNANSLAVVKRAERGRGPGNVLKELMDFLLRGFLPALRGSGWKTTMSTAAVLQTLNGNSRRGGKRRNMAAFV